MISPAPHGAPAILVFPNAMQRGTSSDDYVEVHDEPDHRLCLHNEYAYVYRVTLPPSARTLWHRHTEDTLYFSLADARGREEFPGEAETITDVPCGAMLSRPHRSEPLVHKVTNVGAEMFRMIGAEALSSPPRQHAQPLALAAHTLKFESDRFRAYRVDTGPSPQSIAYDDYGLLIALEPAAIDLNASSNQVTMWLDSGGLIWLKPGWTLNFPAHFSAFFAQWR